MNFLLIEFCLADFDKAVLEVHREDVFHFPEHFGLFEDYSRFTCSRLLAVRLLDDDILHLEVWNPELQHLLEIGSLDVVSNSLEQDLSVQLLDQLFLARLGPVHVLLELDSAILCIEKLSFEQLGVQFLVIRAENTVSQVEFALAPSGFEDHLLDLTQLGQSLENVVVGGCRDDASNKNMVFILFFVHKHLRWSYKGTIEVSFFFQ